MISQSHDDTSRSRGLKSVKNVESNPCSPLPLHPRRRPGGSVLERGLACVPPSPRSLGDDRWFKAGPGQQFQVQPPTPLGSPGFPLGSDGKSARQARFNWFNILCNGRFSKECQPLTDRGELKIESRSHGINMNLSDQWQLCCKAKSDFGILWHFWCDRVFHHAIYQYCCSRFCTSDPRST